MKDLSVRSRREAERHIEALRERWGEFEIETKTVEYEPERFESAAEYFESGGRGGAAALVRNADERVLLAYHTGEDVWGHPGGGHEPGESFADTARRELREETSVEIELAGVWFVRLHRFVRRGDPERRGSFLRVHFLARPADGLQRADASEDDEIARAGWFAPPAWPRPVVSDIESRDLPLPN